MFEDSHGSPETTAQQLFERITSTKPDPEAYLKRVVEELCALAPALAVHFVDATLADLVEEIVRREDSKHSHATVTLIEEIENDWKGQA